MTGYDFEIAKANGILTMTTSTAMSRIMMISMRAPEVYANLGPVLFRDYAEGKSHLV